MARQSSTERDGQDIPILETPPILRWDQIIGQDPSLEVLQRAMKSGRLHHAWLFSGPDGVGRLTTALTFASSLLDPTTAVNLSGQMEPDPDSSVQHEIRSGTCSDLHIVRKELALSSRNPKIRTRKLASIPLDVIYEFLIEPAHRAATVSRNSMASKVFIVDEAELLDRSLSHAPVQNALLKTLEEPPEGTIIILITTHEDRLLPTIRSRCQRLAFRALSEDEMTLWLGRSEQEVDAQSRDWLVRFAQGSPGRMIEALEAGLDSWASDLQPILDALGRHEPVLNFGPVAKRLIDSYAGEWVSAGVNRSKEVGNRQAARQLLSIVADHFRRVIRSGTETEWAVRAVTRCEQASRQLASNVQPALVFDALAADLSA